MRASPPLQFVFLAFLGAERAGGAEYAPPSRARNSQTLSRGRAKLYLTTSLMPYLTIKFLQAADMICLISFFQEGK